MARRRPRDEAAPPAGGPEQGGALRPAPYRAVSRARPLRDQVVQQISDSIRAGRFPPGGRLPTERALALMFGVSRSVIRDALRVLEASGVLGIEHGRGIFVSEHMGSGLGNRLVAPLLGLTELHHLFELRMAVEVAGAGLAALHATDEERRSLVAQADRSLRIPPDGLDEFARADQEFHLLVHAATHNPIFMQVMESLLDLLAVSRGASLRVPGRPRLSMTEHKRVAQRIAQGDPDGARAAMAWHLLSVEEAIAATQGGGGVPPRAG
ncbi:MAG: FadR family transcriptional regulator [Firmicutes bacterium]|nr:FadR family transcriptional regulator [Bacillota bacterium]